MPGVQIGYKREQFNDEIANWASIVRTVSVSGVIDPTASDQTCDSGDPSPPCAPGRMKIRLNTSGNTFFDPNPSHQRNPFNLTSPSSTFSKYFAEFATLGTYVVDFKADVTHTNTNVYSGTNRSTFHVGPVAELTVRDAGPNPAGPSSQRAFTIRALNNGPDSAPAAQVTVDLQGATVSQAIASQGSYNNGVWTIGEFPGGAPTLTLITDAPADTPITATITNTQDYEVCIDSSGNDLSHTTQATCEADTTNGGSWHTAKYYDYKSANNTATVTAQAGTGGPQAAITVEWTAPADVTVSRYQVWRQGSPWKLIAEVEAGQTSYTDTTAEPGRAYLYTVRALDAQGIPVSSETLVAAPQTGGQGGQGGSGGSTRPPPTDHHGNDPGHRHPAGSHRPRRRFPARRRPGLLSPRPAPRRPAVRRDHRLEQHRRQRLARRRGTGQRRTGRAAVQLQARRARPARPGRHPGDRAVADRLRDLPPVHPLHRRVSGPAAASHRPERPGHGDRLAV